MFLPKGSEERASLKKGHGCNLHRGWPCWCRNERPSYPVPRARSRRWNRLRLPFCQQRITCTSNKHRPGAEISGFIRASRVGPHELNELILPMV